VQISQAERMMNLLALLVQRSQPLTLKQIRQELGNQYSPSDTAARAAFERDKNDLRQMGIPIEMITLGGDAAGEGAYKVDRRKFELSDLRLTDSEREALQMAVATIRLGASHGDEALWKLGGERALNTPSTSVNVQLDDSILPALAAGVVEHRTFNFTYKGEKRRVDPYGLLARNGFWYIVGFDHLRGAQRVFRVDRIEGKLEAGDKGSFQRPDGFDLSKAVPTEQEMLAEGDSQSPTAVVLVDKTLASRVRREFGDGSVAKERADGSIEFVIPCANLDAFRLWLFAMVDRAEVLSPPAIRAKVIEWLTQQARGN
jgi:predicted DNA-binding transcriptional regulator YafY